MSVRIFATLAGIIVLSAVIACGSDDDDGNGNGEPQTPTPTEAAVTAEDLARAVVQIQALDRSQEPVWHGSGTFISADGMVLTNAHVVDDRFGEYETLGLAVTVRSDEPPELRYVAEIEAVDYALDLAVLRVVSDVEGQPLAEEFPFVPQGDSDGVGIGDNIRILGYPGIGGETITFTIGVVSGFTSERSVGGRAWIKTDATIAGGNSGGLAVNEANELIGVPTIVGGGSQAEDVVDCRYLVDTNRDGVIDERDTCVPVGGFINGLRPVNLARPLVTAAETGRAYVSQYEQIAEPAAGFTIDDVLVLNLVFADGVTLDDEPTSVIQQLGSGATELCAFWDYEGMENGMSWEAVWFIDGELSEEGSFLDDTWVGGPAGSWWVCIFDEAAGLSNGLYEVVISVEGEYFGSAAIFVGPARPEVFLHIENDSSLEICYAYVSPPGALNWGFDVLDDIIWPGEVFTLSLPAGIYDILLLDCDDAVITEDYELDITEDSVYTAFDLD